MKKHCAAALVSLSLWLAVAAPPPAGGAPAPDLVTPPDSLVLDGIPPVPMALKEKAGRYLEFRSAAFSGWHPTRLEMLIRTRFADTPQLHRVAQPMGARTQLTFLPEPVAGGSYQPVAGNYILYARDTGGGEFYQLYRYNPSEGTSVLLTDGKSRNTGGTWAASGKAIAYTSTRRNGSDNDIYIMDPARPATDHCVLQVKGGGWAVEDWSPNETELLLSEGISVTKSHLHLLDLRTGVSRRLTPDTPGEVAYEHARFLAGGRSFVVTTDRGSEFRRLVEFKIPVPGQWVIEPERVLSAKIPWDIDEVDLSRKRDRVAFVANENGLGVLHVIDVKSGTPLRVPRLPAGVLSGVQWHEDGRNLGFNISSARLPADAFSLDTKTGRLTRWTASETGGLDAEAFAEPQLTTVKSFDGLEVSAFIYRPDPAKFPGPRPVIVNIHGGPESQFRPGFQARNNYYLNELGVVLVFPNVRGSSGYGKRFLTLDNGFKREDSVRDIGAILDKLRSDPGIDPDRIAVMGGSYGGYMVLACMQHFNDRLRCGVDIVGISNFLTFLKNTQDYRRDLRRVEYGDERDPAMREFLEKISPTANVARIRKPLLVVQGKNDPRVPVTEAEQMVKAIRENGGQAWYLMATDEGHGFAKKKNADFQFLVTIAFFSEFLLK